MSDMQSAASSGSSTLTEVSTMSAAELAAVVRSQAEKIAALEHQLDWFRRQMFGQKSERFAPEPDPSQMHLGESFPVPAPTSRTRAPGPILSTSRRKSMASAGYSGRLFSYSSAAKENPWAWSWILAIVPRIDP